MHSFYDILVQAIGFLGLLFFFISFQVKTNKRFFVMQTLGCLTFSLQFALLGAFSGALSLLVNITRNAMLTKYNESALVRWKGWIAVFSALSLAAALLTWSGPISLLPVATTVAGTIGYWTNNARNIRIANLAVNSAVHAALRRAREVVGRRAERGRHARLDHHLHHPLRLEGARRRPDRSLNEPKERFYGSH